MRGQGNEKERERGREGGREEREGGSEGKVGRKIFERNY